MKQFDQINEMWNQEFPVNLFGQFTKLLKNMINYNHYIIQNDDDILAWAVDFERDGETRFSIIVQEKYQGRGFGKLLINRLKKDLGEFYGWVIEHNDYLKQNGKIYPTPLKFYQKIGFEVLYDLRIDFDLIKAVKIRNNANIFAETERFVLREILFSDIEGMFELDSDATVHQFLGNKPVTIRQESHKMIHLIRQQYIDYGIGRWAIIDKNTNEFVGWSGLKFISDLTNNHQNYYELGYRIIKKHWGKGIATETAIASLQFAFENLNATELYAITESGNKNSQKILNKVGLHKIESFDLDGIAHEWFKITKEDYSTYNAL